jgi:hypothetical protein
MQVPERELYNELAEQYRRAVDAATASRRQELLTAFTSVQGIGSPARQGAAMGVEVSPRGSKKGAIGGEMRLIQSTFMSDCVCGSGASRWA